MYVCGAKIEESIKESTVNSMAVVRDKNLPTKNTLWSILFCCVYVYLCGSAFTEVKADVFKRALTFFACKFSTG